MEEVLPLLANTIISTVSDAMSSTATSTPATGTAPAAGRDSLVLSHQALPPAHTSNYFPSGGSVPSIKRPFQVLYADISGTESRGKSITIVSLRAVKELMAPFRDAQLTSLEAVVFPSAGALKIPVTVDLAWTQADVAVEDSSVINIPGATRFTAGGLFITNNGILPCDLNFVNPIIKSPVPFTNAPRLNIYYHPSADAIALGVKGSEVRASIVLRGLIQLKNPICISGGAVASAGQPA